MDIFFCVNDYYVKWLYIAIISIIKNNKKSHIKIHILTKNLNYENVKLIKKCNSECVSIYFHYIDANRFKSMPITLSHISVETYFRYLIPEIDKSIDKALYLDCDIMIKGDLSNLFSINVDNYYCAAVPDSYINTIKYKKTIGFLDNECYVNAGVLLLNLKKIRDENKVEQLFLNSERYKRKILYQDQDIINITFRGHIKSLDFKYNYTSFDVYSKPSLFLDQAIIIHFTGNKKPWNYFYMTKNPIDLVYYAYWRQSSIWVGYYFSLVKNILNFIFSTAKTEDKKYYRLFGLNFFCFNRKK